jgi:GT2 family glycosyltransferase
VLDQTLDRQQYEVLYVDNGSSDGSADLVQLKFPSVRLIQLRQNLGYAAGNNHAVGYALGQYLVFLNQDVIVHKAWLAGLVDAMTQAKADTVFCSNQIPPHAPSFQHQDLQGPLEWVYYLDVTPFGFTRFYYQTFSTNPVHSHFLSGASFMVSRLVLERQPELFDTDFFMYAEDLELSLRLLVQGVEIRYVPASICYHAMGSGLYTTGSSLGPSQMYKAIRITANRFHAYFKNMTLTEFAFFFPLLILGSPLKVMVGPWRGGKKVLAALFMLPLSILAAGLFCWEAARGWEKRKATLGLRTRPAFWLLREIMRDPGGNRKSL